MSKGGGENQTTTIQKADPWVGAQGSLLNLLKGANDNMARGAFLPQVYGGDRVAGFGGNTNLARHMMKQQALGPQATDAASGTLMGMMDQDYTSGQLDAVKEAALSSAIPAATSMFSGSGMLNSSQAMDTVGRAATQAVAPLEYGAYESAQNRALQASEMAPRIDLAGYMPSEMLGQVGSQEDALRQARIDANMQKFNEGANPELQALQRYAGLVYPAGGMGGSSSSTATAPGASTGQRIAGAGLGGLGAYGALAANPVTAPFALGGGVLAGLAGLL